MQCISLPELDIFLLCVASCALFAVIYVKIKNYKKPKETDTSKENIIEFVEEFVFEDGTVRYYTTHNDGCIVRTMSEDKEEAWRMFKDYVDKKKKYPFGKRVVLSINIKEPLHDNFADYYDPHYATKNNTNNKSCET